MNGKRGVKSILIGICFILSVIGGLSAIVGSGGGGGGDSPPPEGAVRLYNNLGCRNRDGSFKNMVGILAIGGKTMQANTKKWSPCRFIEPGSYSARATLSGGGCGTWSWNNLPNAAIANDCTQVYEIDLKDGKPWLKWNRVCPGGCVGSSSLDTGLADTMEEIAVEGILVEEPTVEYSFEE